MKKHLVVLLMLSIVAVSKADMLVEFYIQWDDILVDYGSKKGLDYRALSKEDEKLKKIRWSLAHVDLNGRRPDELKSFYIDAFNFMVVSQITKAYPIESVEEIPGFLNFTSVDVAGEQLTLSQLLNEKIIPFNDSRMLLALNFGTLGSPELYAHAFIPFILDLQLDLQVTMSLNSQHHIRVKPKSEIVLLPEYFLWYRDQFETNEVSVLEYVNTQLREANKCPADFELDYYPFSWKVNQYPN